MSGDTPRTNRASTVLDDLLDHAPAGFLSFRDDGVVELINAQLLDMLDYEAGDVVERHIENILTVGTRIFYQTHWFPLLRLHGSAHEIFLMLRTSGGEAIGALVNAARRERDGRTVYDCVVMRVVERQKYEEELLRARRVAEQAKAELEERQRALAQANELLSAQTVELEQQQQQLQDQATELEAAHDELRATNDDLMERSQELERARAVAEEANEAKSAFLAVMSHELRTPLNAISGYADLMALGVQGPITDAQRESLERIKRSQRHLLRLINDVLNLARIESGHLDYQLDDVAVSALVDDVMPMVEPQITEKGLSFSVSVLTGLDVRADREKVQQILLNLLSNAIKFTPGGGRITLTAVASEDRDVVSIALADTGIGIPADRLESVFEPFVQVDVSRTSRKDGTGLGLSISRDLARGMGGDLRAESVVGAGSTFTLELPRARIPAAPPAPAP